MAEQGNTVSLRDYRKGNWTVHETMILITAKKRDEERRMKRSSAGESTSHDHQPRNKPAELRWKWVEDFCWSNGCLRSQNQCNDKWDNLMREYKKVRDYENSSSREDAGGSYWKLERHERKDRNLPTNMLLEIYEALVEVVEKRSGQRFGGGGGVGGGSGSIMDYVLQNTPMSSNATLQPSLPPLLQLHSSDPTPTPTPPLSALQLPPPPPPCHSFPLLAQILILVRIQIHHQLKEGRKVKGETRTPTLQMIIMKLVLQSQEVLL